MDGPNIETAANADGTFTAYNVVIPAMRVEGAQSHADSAQKAYEAFVAKYSTGRIMLN